MYPRRLLTAPLSALALATTVAVSLASASSAVAQDAPKIAVVDLERVFIDSKLGKELQTALKTLEDATRKKIEDVAKRAQDLESQIAAATNPDDQRNLVRKREDAELEARRLRDDAQREAKNMEQKKQAEFNEQMGPLFKKIQEEKGYDLILNKAQGVVIFAGEALDITDMVLERMGS